MNKLLLCMKIVVTVLCLFPILGFSCDTSNIQNFSVSIQPRVSCAQLLGEASKIELLHVDCHKICYKISYKNNDKDEVLFFRTHMLIDPNKLTNKNDYLFLFPYVNNANGYYNFSLNSPVVFQVAPSIPQVLFSSNQTKTLVSNYVGGIIQTVIGYVSSPIVLKGIYKDCLIYESSFTSIDGTTSIFTIEASSIRGPFNNKCCVLKSRLNSRDVIMIPTTTTIEMDTKLFVDVYCVLKNSPLRRDIASIIVSLLYQLRFSCVL